MSLGVGFVGEVYESAYDDHINGFEEVNIGRPSQKGYAMGESGQLLNGDNKGEEIKRAPPFTAEDLFFEDGPGEPDLDKISEQFLKYCEVFMVEKDGKTCRIYRYNGLYWTVASRDQFEPIFNEKFWPDMKAVVKSYYANKIDPIEEYISVLSYLTDVSNFVEHNVLFPDELVDVLKEIGIYDSLANLQGYQLNNESLTEFDKEIYGSEVISIINVVKEYIKSLKEEQKESIKTFNKMKTDRIRDSIIRKTIKLLVVSEELQWNKDMRYSVWKNGVFDFIEQRMIVTTKEMMIYGNPTATLPEPDEDIIAFWMRLVSQIQPDEDIGRDLLFMYASFLLPKNPKLLFILKGRGKNGKSIIGNAVDRLLGKSKVLKGYDKLFSNNYKVISGSKIKHMHNKHHVTFKEVNAKTGCITKEILSLLSNDDYMTSVAHSDEMNININATFTLHTNKNLKYVGIDSNAVCQLLAVIPFPVTFHQTLEGMNNAIASGGNPIYHKLQSTSVDCWVSQEKHYMQLFYVLAPYVKVLLENNFNFSILLSQKIGEYTANEIGREYDEFNEWLENHLVEDEHYVIPIVTLKEAYMKDCHPSATLKQKKSYTMDWFKNKLFKIQFFRDSYVDKKVRFKLSNGTSIRVSKPLIGFKYIDNNYYSPPLVNIERVV